MSPLGTPDRVVDGDVSFEANGGPVTNSNPLPSTSQPSTSGGLTTYRNLDLDETGVSVKATPARVYDLFLYNNSATVRFVKTYNKATAASAADTPQATYPVPAGSGVVVCSAIGRSFTLGLSLRATTGVADADVGAPAANDVIVVLGYA